MQYVTTFNISNFSLTGSVKFGSSNTSTKLLEISSSTTRKDSSSSPLLLLWIIYQLGITTQVLDYDHDILAHQYTSNISTLISWCSGNTHSNNNSRASLHSRRTTLTMCFTILRLAIFLRIVYVSSRCWPLCAQMSQLKQRCFRLADDDVICLLLLALAGQRALTCDSMRRWQCTTVARITTPYWWLARVNGKSAGPQSAGSGCSSLTKSRVLPLGGNDIISEVAENHWAHLLLPKGVAYTSIRTVPWVVQQQCPYLTSQALHAYQYRMDYCYSHCHLRGSATLQNSCCQRSPPDDAETAASARLCKVVNNCSRILHILYASECV